MAKRVKEVRPKKTPLPEWMRAHQARMRTDAEYREKCAKERKELRILRDTDPEEWAKKSKEAKEKLVKLYS